MVTKRLTENVDLVSLRTLVASLDFEFNLLVFAKFFVAIALNSAEVYEYFCTAILSDESINRSWQRHNRAA
ncbi:MAG: hypothetical protein RLZZ576_232 [Actinomycetota bacterium]